MVHISYTTNSFHYNMWAVKACICMSEIGIYLAIYITLKYVHSLLHISTMQLHQTLAIAYLTNRARG